ncbi:hypothetical protein DSO57_1013509 [Entomophthora muscae]|uniref:Uncharacterized protein n=1 Tax=Entomophthora muscae TaxID=34485 RepID=A0ACC2TH13_9FUNG|nr:hypothetical protein DSO57_1013509 [Entomophthora muscae]
MQISDLHYDREYQEGAEADCNKPICCQQDSNSDMENKTVKSPASKWGEYTCDASKDMVKSMLEHAALQSYDMILFTGDLPAHDMWKEERSRSLKTEEEAFSFIHDYFPGERIYPAIGNHESVPLNQFPFQGTEEGKDFYLYRFMASQWKQWLDEPQLQMVRKVGYYSKDHSHTLKVIVLNNNLFYTYNYYALLHPTDSDPNGMFTWLIQELQEVEDNGGWAYLASHIPPGSTDFYQHWSEAYHRIIERYAHVISGQFYGHLHTDEFEIFYNQANKTAATAISTAYLAPSVSTMNGINPSYRVYSVEQATYKVIDYTQYYADLKKKANWTSRATWEVMYSARDAYTNGYNPPTLDAKFWHLATAGMEKDPNHFSLFQAHLKGKGLVTTACDIACRQRTICTLRAAKSKDNCALITPFS